REAPPSVSRIARPCGGGAAAQEAAGRGIEWSRGTLGADGLLYCGAFDGRSALAVDASMGVARAITSGDGLLSGPLNILDGRAKWSDPSAAADGRLYAAPFDSQSVLVIDPASQSIDAFWDPELNVQGEAKWARGVPAGDGCLYCAPLSAPSVLVIRPEPRSLGLLGDLGCSQGKWNEGVLGADGGVYCSPDSATEVLAIDPETQQVTTFGSLPEGRRKWTKGVLAPDGCIYCAPLCVGSVLVIDPAARSASVVDSGALPGRFLWAHGVLGPDGRIYCGPLTAPSVLVIDPRLRGAQGFLSGLGDFGTDRFKWNHGALGADGRLYFPAARKGGSDNGCGPIRGLPMALACAPRVDLPAGP
ncbi:unnamed protein product, partial [Prorocentrum cordatum]